MSIVQTGPAGEITGVKVRLGAVYEQDEKKRAESENAIFGKYTPHGSFEATIYNEHLAPLLCRAVGKPFYLDFIEAPE